jgi:predicted alpha/beta-hydrolase family hydrolase
MVEGRLHDAPVYIENTEPLESHWKKVVSELGSPEKLIIGGKSIAAFAATRVADQLGVRGVIGMGFPFVSPDPDLILDQSHLKTMKTPAMIIQGSDDPLGPSTKVDDSVFSHMTTLHWLENAGHNFIPSENSTRSHDENILDTMEWIAEFLDFLEQ